jgi:hypothetical protein
MQATACQWMGECSFTCASKFPSAHLMLVVCVHAGDRMPVDGANVHSPVLQNFHQRTLMLVVSVHAGDRMPVDGVNVHSPVLQKILQRT